MDTAKNFSMDMDIKTTSVLAYVGTYLAGLVSGLIVNRKTLVRDRNAWKEMADSQLRINAEIKKKYVAAIDINDKLIKENRHAHQRTQEYRAENNYLFAVLMREGLLRAEDHKHLNEGRLENIMNLFKRMKK